MPVIYLPSCNCGKNNIYTAKVKKHLPDVEIVNTRAIKSRLPEHLQHQKDAGMGGTPLAIVVEEGRTTLLSEWKP